MSNVATAPVVGELLSVERYTWITEGDEEETCESLVQYITQQIANAYGHFAIPMTHQPEDVVDRFRELAECWRSETRFMSSVTEMVTNPSYQHIIGLGSVAVPLILEELRKGEGHWFWALKSITGIDPVPPEHRGRVHRMSEKWLQWGREQGFINPDES